MLANAEIVSAVAETLRCVDRTPIVLDPVMVAKGGASLLDEGAVDVLRWQLMPQATVVTANVPEAEALTGLSILYNVNAGHGPIAQQIKRSWEEHLGVVVTLEELDNHKKGMTEVARNARQASRYLDEMVSATETARRRSR